MKRKSIITKSQSIEITFQQEILQPISILELQRNHLKKWFKFGNALNVIFLMRKTRHLTIMVLVLIRQIIQELVILISNKTNLIFRQIYVQLNLENINKNSKNGNQNIQMLLQENLLKKLISMSFLKKNNHSNHQY